LRLEAPLYRKMKRVLCRHTTGQKQPLLTQKARFRGLFAEQTVVAQKGDR